MRAEVFQTFVWHISTLQNHAWQGLMVGTFFTLIQERNSSAAEIQGAMEVRCGRRAGGLICHCLLGHVEESLPCYLDS